MDKGIEIIKLTGALMLEVLELPLEDSVINDLISKIADIRDLAIDVK